MDQSWQGRRRDVASTKYSLLFAAFLVTAIAALLSMPAAFAQGPLPVPADGVRLAPPAFREATAKVRPSIVRIEGFGGVSRASAGGYPAPGEGPTTGLIVSEDGWIVTSTFNFLRKPPVITVVLKGGERHVAQLLGRDETRKICLLKVDGVTDWPVPRFAPREGLKVGQWTVASGVGFGATEPALSVGILSATSRISGKAVQTDANTSPANYGGPLIDLEGQVIGICVPLSPGSRAAAAGAEWYDSGIGFAIPLDGLDDVLARLKAGERLQPAFLGVRAAPFGDPPTGASVEEVVTDSPAAQAGLVANDKITTLGGTKVLDVQHLATLIGRYLAGDAVEIVVERNGQETRLSAKLAVSPPPQPPLPPPAVEKAKTPKGKRPMQPQPPRPAI